MGPDLIARTKDIKTKNSPDLSSEVVEKPVDETLTVVETQAVDETLQVLEP